MALGINHQELAAYEIQASGKAAKVPYTGALDFKLDVDAEQSPSLAPDMIPDRMLTADAGHVQEVT